MPFKNLKGGNFPEILVLFLVTMEISTSFSEAEECYYKPCERYGDGNKVCQFNIGCKMEGSFATCKVSSMYLDKLTSFLEQSTCIEPGMVPGFKDFCTDLLYNTSMQVPGPANINNDDVTNFPTEGVVRESKVLVDKDCFGTTVLASVATGCFLAGGFIVWLLSCCCRLSICPCSKSKKEDTIESRNDSRWNPMGRSRHIGSTSSAQLLGHASVESMTTHNTLLSNSEGQSPSDVSATGASPDAPSRTPPEAWMETITSKYSHARSPSAPWAETGRPMLPSSRSRSAQWIDPGRISMTRTAAPLPQWHDNDNSVVSRPNAGSTHWLPPGHIAGGQSHSMPWLDTIYAPGSDSSSRDYQSIHGGSENPYTAYSESSSDYSAPHTHRVMVLHDGEIYQASSESSGSNNDYTSLKGQRFSRANDNIYYATSEGSNKDYATLANESDDARAMVPDHNVDRIRSSLQRGTEEVRGAKFTVNGLTFPNQASCKSNRGWTSNLQEINEYETVDAAKTGEENASNVRTLADLCNVNHNTEGPVQPHEYFTLEPLPN